MTQALRGQHGRDMPIWRAHLVHSPVENLWTNAQFVVDNLWVKTGRLWIPVIRPQRTSVIHRRCPQVNHKFSLRLSCTKGSYPQYPQDLLRL